MSKKNMAEELDLSERTVLRAIIVLEAKGLIERSDAGFIRTMDEWNELIANKHDYMIAFNGQEGKLVSGNLHKEAKSKSSIQHLSPSMTKSQDRVTKCHSEGDKMSYNNNIDNNIDNIISKEIEQAPKVEYGNKEINQILNLLKEKIGQSTGTEGFEFADTQQWSRIYAQHCLNLIKKIGGTEFGRRLDCLLADPFTAKNCNKIKFIYNNIKGFIEADKPLSL